jgi:hypothetical protein
LFNKLIFIFIKKLSIFFLLALLSFSCSKDSIEQYDDTNLKAAASSSQWSDYSIALSVSTDGSLWTYTITRTKTNAKNLSHFIIDLNGCGSESATFGDIVWATVNGNPADLAQTEGSGTTCNPQATTTNFVKFDNLPSATSWTLVMKLDRGYSTVSNAAVWIKAGNSCSQGLVSGPGCPLDSYCSYSQGYFFANGAVNNGASNFWSNGLVIGGINYSQIEGNTAWNINRGRGGDQTLNSFFQLGAVRLSGVDSQVSANVAIIDTYFTGIDIFSTLITTTGSNPYSYFNLPLISNGVTKSQVIAAGGSIGSYIDANHCE